MLQCQQNILGEFNRKLKETSVDLRQTEPFIPWSNEAKREIKELKKGLGGKLIKSGTAKKLWVDCLELEAYIRSNTAASMYKLNGDVPKTIIPGEASHICQFCKFEWF